MLKIFAVYYSILNWLCLNSKCHLNKNQIKSDRWLIHRLLGDFFYFIYLPDHMFVVKYSIISETSYIVFHFYIIFTYMHIGTSNTECNEYLKMLLERQFILLWRLYDVV